jgi:hypothetical protein
MILAKGFFYMGKRRLSNYERQEAGLVFGSSLDYGPIWIHEGVRWTDWLGKLGELLRRRKSAGHNAVTLGNHIFFPVQLESDHPQFKVQLNQTAWLMHELTHVWQFQQDGWRYLYQALWAILRYGHRAYHIGSPDTLIQARQAGTRFKDFNREQQGELTRGYYVRLRQGENVEAWKKYINEISAPE